MNTLLYLLALVPASLDSVCEAQFQPKHATGKVAIQFENVTSTGTLRLALYNRKESFLVEKEAVLYNFKVHTSGNLYAELPELPYGHYAFAVFLDENENMVLDKNFLGIPTEPYGFSRTPPSKWRLPFFEEVKFDLNLALHHLTVRLNKWKL